MVVEAVSHIFRPAHSAKRGYFVIFALIGYSSGTQRISRRWQRLRSCGEKGCCEEQTADKQWVKCFIHAIIIFVF